MEKSSKDVDFSSKREGGMTDANVARDLILEAFPVSTGRNVTRVIGDVFTALKSHEKRLPKDVLQERQRRWTERRVKALVSREARRVDHYEIQDLAAVAVEEARLERARNRAREERLAALIAAVTPGGNREASERMGGPAGRPDLPGSGGTDADETADQSRGWGR